MKRTFILIAACLICSAANAQETIYLVNGKRVTKDIFMAVPDSLVKSMNKSVDKETFDNVLEITLKCAATDNTSDGKTAATAVTTTRKERIDHVKVGDKAPELKGRSAENDRKIKSTKGKVVLLNFWGSWCAPCVAELRDPAFGKLINAFSTDKRFRFVAACVDQDVQIRKFISRVTECAFLKGATLSDPNRELFHRYASSGVPRTYIIDANGTIVYAHLGMLASADYVEMETLLSQLLD